MRLPRSLMVRSPAIVISIAALPLSLGGGSYAGAMMSRPASPAAQTFTFHDLTLINGWVPLGQGFNEGRPGYAVNGDVVRLRGALRQPSGSNHQFAVLPRAARPTHLLNIMVLTAADAPGVLEILPNGVIQAFFGNSTTATTLAGISYTTNS